MCKVVISEQYPKRNIYIHTHTHIHTHTISHAPSAHLEVEDTVASPGVSYIPISLSKSSSFFKAHSPLPTTHIDCACAALTVWHHLLTIHVT